MINLKPSFLLLILLASTNDLWRVVSHREDGGVREACSVTRYQDLCIHSLASFSKTAKRSPYLWARAAVSVTITETKSAIVYLARMRQGHMHDRARMALEDCMECFYDAIDELHESLSELRDLESETFEHQMENVQTWMSAALTNEDTCLDGFREKGRRVKAFVARVANVTFFTSNALAMVNKLASSGGGGFNLP